MALWRSPVRSRLAPPTDEGLSWKRLSPKTFGGSSREALGADGALPSPTLTPTPRAKGKPRPHRRIGCRYGRTSRPTQARIGFRGDELSVG
jgi:hypothetical protein